MIHPDIKPIGHVSPRKPVDLNPRAAVTKTPHRAGEISEKHAQVWNAVVSTATGSNISGARHDVPDVSQVDGYLDVSSVSEDAADARGYYYYNTASDNDDYMG